MFFSLSKTLWLFAEPSHALVALSALGLVALWLGRPKTARALLTFSLGLILLVAVLPAGAMLVGGLETRFPPYDDKGPVDGIVLLGGAVDTDSYFRRHGSGLSAAIGRVDEAARLAKLYPNARIVIAGGPTPEKGAAFAEGSALRERLLAFGVAPERIAVDLDSRNTFENAVNAKALAAPKPGERWLLITSAFHMPRAIACFRGVDFSVIADPVDYRIHDIEGLGFNPVSGLESLDLAFHEATGLLAYRLTGKTREVYPGP